MLKYFFKAALVSGFFYDAAFIEPITNAIKMLFHEFA